MADDQDFDRRLGIALERFQIGRESERLLRRRVVVQAEDLLGTLLMNGLAGERMKAQMHERRHRVARRQRAVGAGSATRDQRLSIVGREEIPAARVVEPMLEDRRELARTLEMTAIAGRLVEVEERAREERMVVQEAELLRRSPRPHVKQTAVAPAHRRVDEAHRLLRGIEVPRDVEHAARFGERADHERIPRDDDLLVAKRRHAAGARGVESFARVFDRRSNLVRRPSSRRGELRDVGGAVCDAAAFEVALRRDAPVTTREVGVGGAEDRGHLLRRPDEEATFLTLAVGVGRGVEPAAGVPHLAQQIVERVDDDAPGRRISGDEMEVQVETRKLGVVVQHLLEVRHEPALVDGIAMEAAPDVVVHPAGRHAVARERHGIEQLPPTRLHVLAQEELDGLGVRKFGRPPKPAVRAIDVTEQRLGGSRRQRRIQRRGRRRGVDPIDARHQVMGGPIDLGAAITVRVRHGSQHARKSRHPVAVDRREVGAAVERPPIGREKRREGPAASPDQELHRLHIDVIDVGSFLAVDLDADEELVHQRRDLRVVEAFALHHVTPVAGRIADRQQNRFVFGAGAVECLVTPRIPIDRVVGMLQQVRTGLLRESIRARHARDAGSGTLDRQSAR